MVGERGKVRSVKKTRPYSSVSQILLPVGGRRSGRVLGSLREFLSTNREAATRMGAGSEEVTLILENQGGREICDMAIKNVHLFVRLGVSKLFTQLNERGVLSEELFQFDDSVHEPEGSAIIAFNFFLVSFSLGGWSCLGL
ncbi:hypothetical protein TNCV_1612871 [Trichonephila clavipes]|nr:hypothetical protein TNCV_1612871 [Trichonephila clavipes]